MKRTCKYILIFIVFLAPVALSAQSIEAKIDQAQRYHNSYDFDNALNIYESLLKSVKDSLAKIEIIEKMVLSQNGKNMLQFATIPTVLAKKQVAAKDFYLYYSHLQDSAWVDLPNSFVKEGGHPFYTASYFPKGSKEFFFSTKDNSGAWNIYSSKSLSDTLWSTPELINENLTSSQDDIFPLLSSSGKQLFFCSKGLFGMGGYDIFVSRWNEESQDWDIPQNLGFPFSSPYDDFLFSNTPDGDFTIFASNRNCPKDSINIYVLAFENTPIKQEIEGLENARKIALLEPESSLSKASTVTKEGEKSDFSQDSFSDSLFVYYTESLAAFRAKQDSLSALQQLLAKYRDQYSASTDETELKDLEQKILAAERNSLEIRMEAEKLSLEVQELEMGYLKEGIIISAENVQTDPQPNTKEITEHPEYKFVKHTLGRLKEIAVEVPEKEFDYTFKILDTAAFAESNNLPEGIVYQIQLFVTSSKATLKQLKGLSPIFEKKQPSGKYQYTVGLFRSYKEVLSHLNSVKRAGFPSAFIVAFNSGKGLSIAKARSIEKQAAEATKYRVVLSGLGDPLPNDILSLIRNNCSKDIAKSFVDGQTLYIIAPFETLAQAESFAAALITAGVKGVVVEETK